MGTKLFYKISLIINITLSVLFTGISAYGFITDRGFSDQSFFIFTYLFIVYPSFIWFSLVCLRNERFNRDKVQLAPQQIKGGRIFAILVIIAAASVIFFSLLALAAFPFSSFRGSRWQAIILLFVMFLFIVSGVTAIINGAYYFKAVKTNSVIVNSLINNIGDEG
jgi:hypothetical protein